jgi:hypothetical protein
MPAEYFPEGFFDGMVIGRGHAGIRNALNNAIKVLRIPISRLAAGKELLGILHETKAVKVLGVEVDVKTAEASGTTTVDIGVEGVDDDGLADALSVAAIAKVKAGPAVTVGGTETYYSANTAGALLTEGFVVGTDVDQDYGLFEGKPYWCPANTQLNATIPAGGWTEFEGDLLVTYQIDPD